MSVFSPEFQEKVEQILEPQKRSLERFEPMLISATEASSRLGVSVYNFKLLADELRIEPIKIGNRNFYETAAILDGLSQKLKFLERGGQHDGDN